MRYLLFLLTLLCLLPPTILAQGIDSLGVRPQKQLPPSILAELRRSEHNRTLVYHDTVKASDLERAHAADTASAGSFADSAITLMDTAVSLSHKEWLDSELVEIPELHRVGSRVHFEYPPSIMTESEMTKVAFDSTILFRMNPVSREVLPFFDESPIPMPLPIPKPFEAMVEAGGGNLGALARGFFERRISPRVAVNARADYESNSSLALHSFFDVAGTLNASLGSDPALAPHESSELTAFLNYTGRSLSMLNDSNRTRTMSLFKLGASLEGESDALHYAASATHRQWNENLLPDLGEATEYLSGNADLAVSNAYTLYADVTYSRAALMDSSAIGSEHLALRFGTTKNASIAWDAGIALLGGSDVSQSIAPIVHVRLSLNPRWEIGASLDPKSSLSCMTTLTAIDPFYRSLSGRGAVVDKINLLGYMTYALSADDALRIEANYIARDHEPVFASQIMSDSSVTQIAVPASTKRLAVTGSGNFLLFTRDVLTASLTLTSATNVDSDRTMSYEPSMRFEAAYRFNSMSDVVRPLVRARVIVLPDHTLNMLDLAVNADIWKTVTATFALNNILNGRSDFWPGYAEAPRSVLVSLRYGF